MDKKIDFSFYNQVRARFSTLESGMIMLVSLSSDKVEELMGQVFIEATQFDEYHTLMVEHFDNDKPYVVLYHNSSNDLKFLFRCKEFVRRENLKTGKVDHFKLDPFRKIEFNPEEVRADLVKLSQLLFGDSKAS